MATSYCRADGIEAAPMEGETLLYHPDTKQFSKLNETAAFLWDALHSPRTVDDLARDMSEAYNVGRDQATSDIEAAVAELMAQALIKKA